MRRSAGLGGVPHSGDLPSLRVCRRKARNSICPKRTWVCLCGVDYRSATAHPHQCRIHEAAPRICGILRSGLVYQALDCCHRGWMVPSLRRMVSGSFNAFWNDCLYAGNAIQWGSLAIPDISAARRATGWNKSGARRPAFRGRGQLPIAAPGLRECAQRSGLSFVRFTRLRHFDGAVDRALKAILGDYADLLHTPQVPPSLAQCLQYLQFLHALHGSAPTQVANEAPEAIVISTTQTRALGQIMCVRWGI